MFKHSYVAKVGFVKNLDRTCPTHGGMYSSNERNACPKCGVPLNHMAINTQKGVRKTIMTEVTLYPVLPQNEKDEHASRTKKASGFEYEIKMVLWGHYDEERGTVFPDKRVQYIVPKRTLLVEFHTKPVVRPFVTREQEHKLEFKYTVTGRDMVKFLDSKATYEALTGESASAPAATNTKQTISNPVVPQTAIQNANPQMALIMEQLASLTAMVNGMNTTPQAVPTPTPQAAPATMTANETECPNPDGFFMESPPDDIDPNDDGLGPIDPFSV